MTEQFNIRSKRARAIATDLSRVLGKPLALVVEEALETYQATVADKEREAWLWGPGLKAAQAAVRASKSDFRIEDLYDPETGLPA